MHFVRDRNGQIRAVSANYTLADGESVSVGMMAFDHAAPPTPPVLPSRCGPPKALKDDDAIPTFTADFARGASDASYELYRRRISNAWRDAK